MTCILRFPVALVLLAIITLSPQAWASEHGSNSADWVLERIIEDVIWSAAEAAREEVRRNTGIDPLRRGYVRGRSYDPVPSNASDEVRRELRQLNRENDRTMRQLEEELNRKLDKAEDEFRRDAAKEDNPEKIAEKGDKLQEKTDEADAKFDEKIREENERYDEKRWQILSQERGS